MSEFILKMQNIDKSFYGVQVLKNASIDVKAGEVHVLLGENGAGKSTLIKILSGAYKKQGGQIFLDGKEMIFASPKEAIDLGVSVIYQEFNLNPFMPIYENVLMGKEYCKNGIIDKKRCIAEAKRYLDLIGLDDDPRTLVSNLSVAKKQMVEIAKAISTNAKIIVLDEPTAAITDKETKKLFEIVNDMKRKGIGIIYISHRMSELFEIGDRCTVMRDGEYVTTVNLCDTNVDELTKLMVGRQVDFKRIINNNIQKDIVVLDVNNITYKNIVKDVSFKLCKGEILGFSGLVGAGRTELAKCIIGALKKDNGTITIEGNSIKENNILDAINKGVVYLSEDRKDEGLVLMHPISDNIALPNLNRMFKFFLSNEKITRITKDYINALKIKTSSHNLEAKNLSGGNQQKVVIAKWLYTDAKVYIFDEPTRGIDVGARDEIYNIMLELTKNGASVIIVSSDLTEIQKMCNRIIVLKEGEITANIENNDELTQDELLSYALTGGKQ